MRAKVIPFVAPMICIGGLANAQPVAVGPTPKSVTWTLIAPPDGRFQVRIPCSEAEIAALLKDDRSRVLPSVGCKKPEYSAVAVFMPGAPSQFFERQVRDSKKNRIAPEHLNGHRVVRWRNILKSGVGESTGQLVELGPSNYLMMVFELRTPVTSASREVAERFLNSVVVGKK